MDKWQVWTQTSATWEGNGHTLLLKWPRSNSCCHVVWKSKHSYYGERKQYTSFYQKLKCLYLHDPCENILTFHRRRWVPLISFNFLFYLTAPQIKTSTITLLPLNSSCIMARPFHAAQIHQFLFYNYPLHLTEIDRREQEGAKRSQALEIKRQRG